MTKAHALQGATANTTWKQAPTRTIKAGGVTFAFGGNP
jgi:hypothetical protein